MGKEAWRRETCFDLHFFRSLYLLFELFEESLSNLKIFAKNFYFVVTLYLLYTRELKVSINLCYFKKVFSQNLGKVSINLKSSKSKYKPRGICMDKHWKKIKGFPEYSVSTSGEIRNDARRKPVRTSLTKQGGVKVGLMSGGKQFSRGVKNLVAEAFVPGKSETMDTPMLLDGNQENLHVSNIVWRPRWFAWKYHRQFDMIKTYAGVGPIYDRRSGIRYEDIVEAGIVNGLLFNEINLSLLNHTPCFPNWLRFDWAVD